jgi:hypothetical protein
MESPIDGELRLMEIAWRSFSTPLLNFSRRIMIRSMATIRPANFNFFFIFRLGGIFRARISNL